jgi:peptide/nickel transport system substrate-binding protein
VRNAARLASTALAAAVIALTLLVSAAAEPRAGAKYGGTLVVGLSGGDPETLDPTVTRGTGIFIYPALCQRLYVQVRNHGKIEFGPQLAASLPALSKDRRSYTVQLRRGVLFNDGTPLTAEAVVTTIKRFMTHPASSRASDYTSVESVTATGPHTVVFRLRTPDSTIMNSSMYVLSPTALAREGVSFAANPVCVGPFMFDSRVVGESVTLLKSPHYFDRANVYLDKIVYKPTTNTAAAAAALKAGDLHVVDQLSASELQAIQRDPNLRVLTSPQLGWRGLVINIGNKSGLGKLPYTNVGTSLASSPTLRQAFEEAINREELNRVVFGGLFQTTCTPIPPANTTWYAAVKAPCTPHDPAHARTLVTRSGVPNPTVHLLVPNTTDTLLLAQVIQAQEKEVGINVVIESADSATVTARQTSGAFDVSLTGLQPGSPEPNTMVGQFFATEGARNYGGYSNARVDWVLTNGVRATELKARAVNYRVAQQIIHADRPAIFLYNITTLAGVSASLAGVHLEANGRLQIERARFK